MRAQTFALLAAFAAVASAPSRADELDLSALTCAAFTKKVADTPPDHPQAYFITILNTWMYGYASAKGGGTKLSGDAAKRFAADLQEECGKKPGESLLTAAEGVGLRTFQR